MCPRTALAITPAPPIAESRIVSEPRDVAEIQDGYGRSGVDPHSIQELLNFGMEIWGSSWSPAPCGVHAAIGRMGRRWCLQITVSTIRQGFVLGFGTDARAGLQRDVMSPQMLSVPPCPVLERARCAPMLIGVGGDPSLFQFA